MTELADLHKIAQGREAEIYAWEDGAVLRLLRNPNAQQQAAWESEAMGAARASGVSVPAVLGTATVGGRPGIILERIDGIDMLTLIGSRPWLVWQVGRVTGEIHAALHAAVAPADLPSIKDVFRRHISESPLVPDHLRGGALDLLAGLPDGDRLCHGDFHPGNVMRTDGEPVLIDWTNVTRGDPDADLCRTRLMLRMGDVPPGSPIVIRVGAGFARRLLIDAYERSYRKHRPIDEEKVERWRICVMTNRLTEDIPEERAKLLTLLDEAHAAR